MALSDNEKFNLEGIQRAFNIKQKSIDNLQIEKEELEKIWNDFKQSSIEKLEPIRVEILSILNENLVGKVHSIRSRVKEPNHLIEKIIRNSNLKPDKYHSLNVDNYYKAITDLIGIRIIILDKKDWWEIHKSLLEIFQNIPERYVKQPGDTIKNYDKYDKEANKKGVEWKNSYHAEEPIVYITSEDDRDLYKDKYLRVDTSKTHYRSLHYIIRYKFVYIEIQVRTLFEEGWLEFDHRIKYPYDQSNKRKQEYAAVLSSLAIAADRLISFYNEADFRQKEQETFDDIDKIVEQESDNEKKIQKEQTLDAKMKQYF